MPKKFGVLPKKETAPTARDSKWMLAFRVDLCSLNGSEESVKIFFCKHEPRLVLLSAAQKCHGPLQEEGETKCKDIKWAETLSGRI